MMETVTTVRRMLSGTTNYVIGSQGMQILGDLSQEEWNELGLVIRNRLEGAQWALGDWLVYGGKQGRQETVRLEHSRWVGGGYELAARITGYSPPHLSNCFRVSAAFTLNERVTGLSFTHHKMAMALTDHQDRLDLLAQAQREHWTTEDLDRKIQARFGETPQPTKPSSYTGNRHTHTMVECPECHAQFKVKGHQVPRAADV